MGQVIGIALDSLHHNPLRTALSTLGIVMGAASLAAVLALGDGAERFLPLRIEREGMNLVVVRPRTEDVIDGLRVPRMEFPLFGEADAEDLARVTGPGASVRLATEGTGLIETPGAQKRAARVRAELLLNGLPGDAPVASGRALALTDRGAETSVALVSHKLAEELNRSGAAGGVPGQVLTIQGRAHMVIGVLPAYPDERELGVQVPFAAADRAMVSTPQQRVRTLTARAAAVEAVPSLKARVEQWVAGRPGWRDSVRIEATGARRLDEVAKGVLVFKMLMGAFTAISLLVGGIGITNVLLASILERTREIGVRKAVGARRRDLVLQFVAESVTIALAGALVGVACGIGGALGVTALIRARSEVLLYAAVTWQTLAVSVAAAVTVGLIAGIYPALNASRLTPMDAIQRE